MCSFDAASLRSLPFDRVDCRASASLRLLLPLQQPTSTGIPLLFPSQAVRTRFSTQKYNLEPAFDASFLIFIDLMRWGFQARLCSGHPSSMLHLLRKTTVFLANLSQEVPFAPPTWPKNDRGHPTSVIRINLQFVHHHRGNFLCKSVPQRTLARFCLP